VRLFLSSAELGPYADTFVSLCDGDKKVAVICSAMDAASTSSQASALNLEMTGLREFGFDPRAVDLREYFGDPSSLRDDLQPFHAMWVRGGNTFVLRAALALSGGDHLITERLARDDLVYGAYSAGACVLCPSLVELDASDDPNDVLRTYGVDAQWDGLGILDYWIVPHVNSSHPVERQIMNGIVDRHREAQRHVEGLRNGEVLTVRGSAQEILGRPTS